MLRMSPSLSRFRLKCLPTRSPWVCRVCQIHASAGLRVLPSTEVSFPSVDRIKTKKKTLRVEESMTEAEKEIIRDKQAREHKKFIERLEEYIVIRSREMQRGLRLDDARKKKAKADLILKTAKRMRVTPLSWPTISKKAITSDDLMMLHTACKKTLEEIEKNGGEIPADLQIRKWVDRANMQKGIVEPKQETTDEKDDASKAAAEENSATKEQEEPPVERKPRMTPKEKKLEVDAVTIHSHDLVLKRK
ncbi:hypothetical protein AA313_de0206129 [Arthrobotrys entomopaga]|nr:hypothetical protein AA313_de0206129 [Arthrobotrys entomopaga]